MKKSNETLHELATIQTAVEELFKKHIGICGISQEGVHLSDSFFHSLFEDKREVVGRKDFSKANPFMYYTHFSGTKFFCISDNPNLFPIYPVEKLAQDLANEWEDKEVDMDKYGLAYHDGNYKIVYKKLLTEGQQGLLETHDLYHVPNTVKETIEQAILDHMEGVHNNDKN